MKSKAKQKEIEKAMKRAKVDMKRAKARNDSAMLAHHTERYRALAA